MKLKRFLLALVVVAALFPMVVGLLTQPAGAQVSVPNTLVAGTTIRAADLNTNFTTLGNHALDRLSGGTISGNVTMDPGITIDGLDLSASLCPTCAAAFADVTVGAVKATGDTTTKWYFPSAGAAAVSLAGVQRLLLDNSGLTVFGNSLINTAGKIPALSSTYFGSLNLAASNLTGALPSIDGSSLTGLNGSNVTSGTVPAANAAEQNEVKFYEKGCPSGFTDLSATYGGRYIVIMPASGTLSATVGTALTNTENRAVGQHTHTLTMDPHNHGVTDPGHTHSYNDTSWTIAGTAGSNEAGNFSSPGATTGSSTTGLTINNTTATGTIANSGSVAGTNAPYVQLRACRKS